MVNKCYLCGEGITPENDSLEHIIPNSLGGRLKTRGILCREHNTQLGIEIDAPFNQTIGIFTDQLNLNKDRNGYTQFEVYPRTGERIKHIVKGNIIAPARPYYDEKKNFVYANSLKIAEQFIQTLQLSEEQDKNLKIYHNDGRKFYIENNLDPTIFGKGLAKIAIGFALNNGVELKDLEEIIDKDKKQIKDPSLLYYIQTETDKYVDKKIENFYPLHILRLKSDGNILGCFIELFSTIRLIVGLTNNYRGEPKDKFYLYSLNKQREISFEKEIKPILNEKNALYCPKKMEFKWIDNNYILNVFSEKGLDFLDSNLGQKMFKEIIKKSPEEQKKFVDKLVNQQNRAKLMQNAEEEIKLSAKKIDKYAEQIRQQRESEKSS